MAFPPDSSQYGSPLAFVAVYSEEAAISDSSNERTALAEVSVS